MDGAEFKQIQLKVDKMKLELNHQKNFKNIQKHHLKNIQIVNKRHPKEINNMATWLSKLGLHNRH